MRKSTSGSFKNTDGGSKGSFAMERSRASSVDLTNNPLNASASISSPSELPTNDAIIIWPEWSEADIQAEKWALKQPFEDPDGFVLLPKSLRDLLQSFKRPTELLPESQQPVLVNGALNTTDEYFYNNEQNTMLDNTDGNSRFYLANQHVLHSELMRSILCNIQFLYDHSRYGKVAGLNEEGYPWDCIYPKGKDGLPTYNPSGKYAVKLYWLGAWRKIVVDDRIPVNATGQPLLVVSPNPQEFWSLILTKAILKLACMSYKEVRGSSEMGDFDVYHCLKGWIPEGLPVDTDVQVGLWNILSTLTMRMNSGTNNGGSVKNGVLLGQQTSNQTKVGGNGRDVTSAGTKPNTTTNRSQSFSVVYAIKKEQENESLERVEQRSFAYRILEVRDADETNGPFMIKIKTYLFGCGTNRAKKLNENESIANITPNSQVNGNVNSSSEKWMSFDDFAAQFKRIVIYHDQSAFKCIKSMSLIATTSAEPNATLKVEPYRQPNVLLFNTDSGKSASVIVVVSSFGRSRSSSFMKACQLGLEEYDWKKVNNEMTLNIGTNGVNSGLISVPAEGSFRVSLECPLTAATVQFYTRDETVVIDDEVKYLTDIVKANVTESEETFTPNGPWGVLFKQVVKFGEPTVFYPQLFVPESVQQAVCLRLINLDKENDDGVETGFYSLKAKMCEPNKNGYLLMADVKLLNPARLPFRWKLRCVSDKTCLFGEMGAKLNNVDVEDVFHASKNNVMFRYVLKSRDALENILSAQLSIAVASAGIFFQVLNGSGVEIARGRGRGVATIYSVLLLEDDEPISGKAGKDAKGGKLGAKNASIVGSEERHRYIIQGFVEDLAGIPVNNVKQSIQAVATAALKNIGGKAPGGGAGSTSTGATNQSGTKKGAANNKPVETEDKDNSLQQPAGTHWKLRLISSGTATAVYAKDTEKEERYKAMKESWEGKQPGRLTKAKELRETYFKQVDGGAIKPVVFVGSESFKAWDIARSGNNKLLSDELKTSRDKSREAKTAEMVEILENMLETRGSEKNYRKGVKSWQTEQLDKKYQEVDGLKLVDKKRRDEYKNGLLKEIEKWTMEMKLAENVADGVAGVAVGGKGDGEVGIESTAIGVEPSVGNKGANAKKGGKK